MLLKPFGVAYIPLLTSQPATSFVAHPTPEGLTSITFSGGYRVAELTGVRRTTVSRLGDGPPRCSRRCR